MPKPLLVEVVAYAPTAFYHCTHCEVAWSESGVTSNIHREQVQSSLPPDLAQDYQSLSDWIRELLERYCDGVLIRVVDAASIEGVLLSLRYRVRRYPAVIIAHGPRFQAGAFDAAEQEIARRLGQAEHTLA